MRPQPFFNLQAFRVSALGWQPAQPTLALLRSSLEMEKKNKKKKQHHRNCYLPPLLSLLLWMFCDKRISKEHK